MKRMSTTVLPHSETSRYDRATIALHWATAILIGLLWLGGQTVDSLGHAGAPFLRSIHITLGITLALVLIARVVWRSTGGRHLRPPGEGLLALAASGGHVLLYILAIGTVLLGLTTEWFRSDTVFGLFVFPGSADRTLAHMVHGWHALAANGIMIVALGHAAMGLLHQYFLRDGTLNRMLPED